MKKSLFTPEELEELRLYDEQIDNEEMTDEDYRISDFVDELLFPEKKKVSDRKKREYNRHKEQIVKESGEEGLKKKFKEDYAKKDKEAERERKRIWYQQNKDRIRAQQKAYRVKTGRQMSAEEKAAKKKAKAA